MTRNYNEIPPEILLKIFDMLEWSSLMAISSVSKYTREIVLKTTKLRNCILNLHFHNNYQNNENPEIFYHVKTVKLAYDMKCGCTTSHKQPRNRRQRSIQPTIHWTKKQESSIKCLEDLPKNIKSIIIKHEE